MLIAVVPLLKQLGDIWPGAHDKLRRPDSLAQPAPGRVANQLANRTRHVQGVVVGMTASRKLTTAKSGDEGDSLQNRAGPGKVGTRRCCCPAILSWHTDNTALDVSSRAEAGIIKLF